MYLRSLFLQNFRNYKKSEFTFNPNTILIVGPNTSGKTNFIEAIYCLSSGKSFRAEKDAQMILFGQEMARVKTRLFKDNEIELESVFTLGSVEGIETSLKKHLLNGVSKRRSDFIGTLSTVLFSPVDLELIIGSPSIRRLFLDDTLEQVDSEYRVSLLQYVKALRQRNALLDRVKETGIRSEKQFEYWNTVLINNGQIITKKRQDFLEYVNSAKKEIFDLQIIYDKSIISQERLNQYKDAEAGAGVTLVGPHRDDFLINMLGLKNAGERNLKFFGSRGQQRLAVLQLKILQLSFMEQKLGFRPVLLLDDIFSELDKNHIGLVWDIIGKQQTFITTTHKEFIPATILKTADLIELKDK